VDVDVASGTNHLNRIKWKCGGGWNHCHIGVILLWLADLMLCMFHRG